MSLSQPDLEQVAELAARSIGGKNWRDLSLQQRVMHQLLSGAGYFAASSVGGFVGEYVPPEERAKNAPAAATSY